MIRSHGTTISTKLQNDSTLMASEMRVAVMGLPWAIPFFRRIRLMAVKSPQARAKASAGIT